MRPHFLLPFAAVAPFPLKESPAVAHVRLPRLPGVSPQLQLQLDPAEDSYLFIGQARVSAIFPHCVHTPNLCQRNACQMRRTSEESIYLEQSQELREYTTSRILVATVHNNRYLRFR